MASIAEARIKELSQILLYQNINLKAQQKKLKVVFLEIDDQNNFECFKKITKIAFQEIMILS